MPRFALILLGSPHVELDGQPVALRRRKALALLVYLTVSRRSHSRDALATLLWPGYGQTDARGHLRRALTSLRRTLGQEWIAADRSSVTLAQDADIRTDVDQFHQFIARCGNHGHPLEQTCPRCLENLENAVALYQDGFLAGFTLPDAPDFDAWQRYQTDRLHNECMVALDKLMFGNAAQGETAMAVDYGLRRLRFNAAHEPTHRRLMRLYASLDQRDAALRQYEQCVQALREELGAEPSAETTALREEIFNGAYHQAVDRTRFVDSSVSDSPDLPSAEPLGERTSRTAAHNLPAETTPFVGRLDELASLARLFADPDHRLVTILGPGGIGKTRLALEAARLLVDDEPEMTQDGLFFVHLAQLSDAQHMVPAIAEALNFHFHFHSGDRSARQQLLDYLGPKQLLLILDNVEHLLAGVDLVQELLEACPNLRLLATSRQRLLLMSETVYTLGSMDFPTWETPGDALGYSSVQLFCQNAQRVRSDWVLPAEEMQYVARICRLVGGMPLGIILAATWVEVLSPHEIAMELTHGFDLLETQLRDLPERQRSMRTVLAYSWRMLEAADRDVFMRLTVFRGGFGREAATEVAGATLPALARLVEKSFIQRTTDGRYDIHELLRQYGTTQLEAAGEAQRTQAAHSHYFLDFLHHCETSLAGSGQLSIMAEIEADFENIRTAWQEAVRARDYAMVDRALDGLFRWFWLHRARQRDGLALFRSALEQWAPEPGQASHPTWNRISTRTIEQQQGAWLTSVDRGSVEQNLALARQKNDRREIAFSRWVLGLSYVSEYHSRAPEHEIGAALDLYEESLVQFRTVDDRFFEAQVLENLGHCQREMYRLEDAISSLQSSLEIRQLAGDRFGTARSYRELGFAAWLKGQKQETANAWSKAYEIHSELEEKQGMADCLFFLGVLALNDGERPKAVELTEEALAIAIDIKNPHYRSWAERSLTIASAMAKHERQSERPICSYPNQISQFSARLFFALYTVDPARLDASLALLWNLMESEADAAICLSLSARYLAATGDREEAARVLALAFRYPAVASGWIGLLPEMSELKQSLRFELAPPIFERAWCEGDQLDFECTIEALRTSFTVTPR